MTKLLSIITDLSCHTPFFHSSIHVQRDVSPLSAHNHGLQPHQPAHALVLTNDFKITAYEVFGQEIRTRPQELIMTEVERCDVLAWR